MEAPMSKHIPSVTTTYSVDDYLRAVDRALDAYKQGNISHTEALANHERSTALLTDALRSHFLVRLNMTEALRTPRGQDVPNQAGR
jgi:hypothetical protein